MGKRVRIVMAINCDNSGSFYMLFGWGANFCDIYWSYISPGLPLVYPMLSIGFRGPLAFRSSDAREGEHVVSTGSVNDRT